MRHYWPSVGGQASTIGRLVAGLAARQVRSVVLTPRRLREWPPAIEHHGARVVRLDRRGEGWWARGCYLARLARWLWSHRGQFDLVCVDGLRYDARIVLAVARRRFPVVLLCGGAAGDDCRRTSQIAGGPALRRCWRRAAAIVAPAPDVRRHLVSAGFPASKTHCIRPGVPAARRQPDSCRRARIALAAANPALELPEPATVAVCTSRLRAATRLDTLVAAWLAVAGERPDARLWLLGDDAEAGALARQIERSGLPGRVVLAGTFDDVEDALLAADLYVCPAVEQAPKIGLIEAMAAGLPVIAADVPANRALIDDAVHGRLAAAGDPLDLARVILEVLADPEQAARMGRAAAERARHDFSLDTMIDRYWELFQSLT